jgi:orotate phosphoribosyltransferase-like protein
MKESKYRKQRRAELIKKAVALYKQGYTTREVGRFLDRSHGWVAYVVKNQLSTAR